MKRSQAALFDGIMLLLFASFSVAMVYSFLNEYGKAQDASLRSGYVISYIQQAGKTLFFIHVKNLKDVANPALPDVQKEVCWRDPESGGAGGCTGSAPVAGFPYSDLSGSQGCSALGQFELSTVSEMLKKDLGDGGDEAEACLDDYFGKPFSGSPPSGFCVQHSSPNWNSVPRVPGKTALRCAVKEIMKPLQTAGFKYFVDVQKSRTTDTIPQEAFGLNPPRGFRITNHWQANAEGWSSCEDVVSKGKIDDVLTTSIPFRVNKGTTLEESFDFTLRVCIWPSKARA